MNVKAAAQRWNISKSTVLRLCSDGMVLGAELDKQWSIPDGTEKPRLTRHRANMLMKDMDLYKEGARFPVTASIEDYKFLAENRFITDITGYKTVDEILASAHITSKGSELIKAEECERTKNKSTQKIKTEVGIKLGPLSLSKSEEYEK